ncbi:LLM class flavin-dependent oxidoreductase [Pseudonocardia sp. NPDC049154]|uniref:LLM class flavin-dependent oxidoreductase n=1 Tax=Pseudonocardia sp. NPDC049154 TaxID=3155501 RepID=UPI0033E8F257
MQIGLSTGDLASAAHDARAAEAAGFDYLACGEHLFFHGPTPNAFIHLAAAAGATSRIRLVSTITLLPLYPATLAAKLASALDVASGGRFELGVGAGGEFPPEFEAAGVDPADRFRRLDEGLRVLRSLFSGGPTTVEGEFTTVRGLALQPGPVQSGGPPIWLGGRKEGAMRRAGRYADVWMPYMVDPERLHQTLQRVREMAADHDRAPSEVAGAVFLWTCADPDGATARERGIAAVSRTYAQDFTPLADRYLALGTPREVADRLREFAAAGAERIILSPACAPAERERLLRVLAEEVLHAARSRP